MIEFLKSLIFYLIYKNLWHLQSLMKKFTFLRKTHEILEIFRILGHFERFINFWNFMQFSKLYRISRILEILCNFRNLKWNLWNLKILIWYRSFFLVSNLLLWTLLFHFSKMWQNRLFGFSNDSANFMSIKFVILRSLART